MEEVLVAIRAVGDLESKLTIGNGETWKPQDQKYKDALQYMRHREFHCALDRVEHLVIQRLFELSKANIAGMGYKMRTSIWKALKTRGKAIRNALRRYNSLAQLLRLPAPILEWKDIVNYTFISEFDILRHTYSRSDITLRPWALQKNREITSRYFKVLRAREEIRRLDVEMHRLYTSLDDEEALFEKTAQRIGVEGEDGAGDATLAAEICAVLKSKLRVNAVHHQRIGEIWDLPEFQGPCERGTRVGTEVLDTQVPVHGVAVQRRADIHDDMDSLMPTKIDGEPVELDDSAKDSLASLGEFMENLAAEEVPGEDGDEDGPEPARRNGVPITMLSTFHL